MKNKTRITLEKTQATANLQVQDMFNQLRDTQRLFNPAMARFAAAFLCGQVLKAPTPGLPTRVIA